MTTQQLFNRATYYLHAKGGAPLCEHLGVHSYQLRKPQRAMLRDIDRMSRTVAPEKWAQRLPKVAASYGVEYASPP